MQRLKRLETRLRRLRNRAAPLLYAGTAVHCPICARSFRRFRTAGRARRRNAVCPGCGARERDRLATLFLRRLPPTTRILHIAPEACLTSRLRALARCGYDSADLMRTDVSERLDVLALPHPDGAFGGVYCSHVLQDVRDDIRAMAEVFRVLAPSGWAILNVPIKTAATIDHRDAPLHVRADDDPRPPEHLRTYGRDFRERMASVGFSVRVATAADLVSAPERRRLGIDDAGALHFGIKP